MLTITPADFRLLGRTGFSVPPIIFGTSALGNLYAEIPYERKRAIAGEWFKYIDGPVALDSAGKYGAGLALETLGQVLGDLAIPADRVILSNKLGWKRVPLVGPEPSFEQGVWFGLKNDAVSSISYHGILECYEQGNELLGGIYRPELVSVHDPDEYLATAADPDDRRRRFDDIVGAYEALTELRSRGDVRGVGIGSKDWTVIREIADAVDLDWVMLACSLTVYTHPHELLDFVATLADRKIGIVNSAVFNAGFLTGGDYFDYRVPDRRQEPELFSWRDEFFRLCGQFDVVPANACIEFGLSVPGTCAVALNTANPARVRDNVGAIVSRASAVFWNAMKERGLIDRDYGYLGAPL